MRVVCTKNEWKLSNLCKCPFKGDICEVEGIKQGYNNHSFYYLKGFNDTMPNEERISFNVIYFRPVDETFGEVVCQTIEEQIQYEEAIKA